MTYTRTTISLPADILKAGQGRASEFRLSFSDYVARLVDEDCRSQRQSLTILAIGSASPARQVLYEQLTSAEERQMRRKNEKRGASRNRTRKKQSPTP